MAKLTGLLKQLKKERDRVERQLSGLNAAISAFAHVYAGNNSPRKPRKVSAASRQRMAAAQRARWAKARRAKKSPPQ